MVHTTNPNRHLAPWRAAAFWSEALRPGLAVLGPSTPPTKIKPDAVRRIRSEYRQIMRLQVRANDRSCVTPNASGWMVRRTGSTLIGHGVTHCGLCPTWHAEFQPLNSLLLNQRMVLHQFHAAHQRAATHEWRAAPDALERLIGAKHSRFLAQGSDECNLGNQLDGFFGTSTLAQPALHAARLGEPQLGQRVAPVRERIRRAQINAGKAQGAAFLADRHGANRRPIRQRHCSRPKPLLRAQGNRAQRTASTACFPSIAHQRRYRWAQRTWAEAAKLPQATRCDSVRHRVLYRTTWATATSSRSARSEACGVCAPATSATWVAPQAKAANHASIPKEASAGTG